MDIDVRNRMQLVFGKMIAAPAGPKKPSSAASVETETQESDSLEALLQEANMICNDLVLNKNFHTDFRC